MKPMQSGDAAGRMLNIGVVTPIPTPYRDPFWNAVAAEPGIKLTVYYCAATTADRPWSPDWKINFQAEYLEGVNVLSLFPSQGFAFWNPQITRRLLDGNHNALIIGGYNYPTMMAAIQFARKKRIPYFLMSESHLKEPRAAWRRLLKRPIVRWVLHGAAGTFPTGTWARDYLLHYGAQPDRMWFLPNVPDVDSLDARAMELTTRRVELRRRFELGDGPIALFVGRLIEFKRVDLLIEAFSRESVSPAAQLVIVGDGVLRARLEAQAARLGIAERVHFKGFVEPADVPLWYAAADVMVLPSTGETWSVAVIEALASGLPVVTTDSVGAAADAVNDPVVGTVIPTGDVDALAAAISQRLAEPVGRAMFRDRWKPVREQFRYDFLAQRVVGAIRRVIETRRVTNAT